MAAIPLEVHRYDLSVVQRILTKEGWEADDDDFVVVAKKEDMDLTVYRTGRVMVFPMKDKKQARPFFEAVFTIIAPAMV